VENNRRRSIRQYLAIIQWPKDDIWIIARRDFFAVKALATNCVVESIRHIKRDVPRAKVASFYSRGATLRGIILSPRPLTRQITQIDRLPPELPNDDFITVITDALMSV